ncbi:MAG TPA: AMP-binding protein [Bryobacteraceae bacterium]|nr:AMP-binding protein [Bryobacteraceae bacterium]
MAECRLSGSLDMQVTGPPLATESVAQLSLHPSVQEETPLDWVYRWEKQRAQQVYLTQPFEGGTREWTWAQAMGEARRMAAYLIAQDWPPGSNIVILSKNCAWWIMAELAIWMSGHVTVPLYSSLTAASIRALLEHSEAKACFLGAVNDPSVFSDGIPPGIHPIRFPNAPALDLPDWQTIVTCTPPLTGRPTRPADDIATVIYTSGTTGAPKGAVHRFRAFQYFAKASAHVIGEKHEERLFSYLPLAHIAERALMETLSFRRGSHIFFCGSLDTFLVDLQRARPTIFFSVPRLYVKFQYGVLAKISQRKLNWLLRIPVIRFFVKRRILRELGLDRVRVAASGAAPLPLSVLQWFRSIGLNLVEGYGMTETGITHTPEGGRSRPGYVGNRVPGVTTKIAENGEILVRSPMNMLCYYKDPERTQSAFTGDGFFRTGDQGEVDPDGWLKVTGRVKEQFKTAKGEYVAPCAIEKLMSAHPAIETCIVMGSGAPQPFAIAVLTAENQSLRNTPAGRAELERSLKRHVDEINAQLELHERLGFLVIARDPWSVENGFVTPTLKVRRSKVESRYSRFVEEYTKNEHRITWEE